MYKEKKEGGCALGNFFPDSTQITLRARMHVQIHVQIPATGRDPYWYGYSCTSYMNRFIPLIGQSKIYRSRLVNEMSLRSCGRVRYHMSWYSVYNRRDLCIVLHACVSLQSSNQVPVPGTDCVFTPITRVLLYTRSSNIRIQLQVDVHTPISATSY